MKKFVLAFLCATAGIYAGEPAPRISVFDKQTRSVVVTMDGKLYVGNVDTEPKRMSMDGSEDTPMHEICTMHNDERVPLLAIGEEWYEKLFPSEDTASAAEAVQSPQDDNAAEADGADQLG